MAHFINNNSYSPIPMLYDDLNLFEGLVSPSTLKSKNNKSFWYWFRHLYLRVKGNIDINLDPIRTDAQDFITAVILIRGFAGFARDKKVGVFGQIATLKGFDFYFLPSSFIITNPKWKDSKEYTNGKDGYIVRCLPDYMGIYDILCYYAEKLSLLDQSTDMSIVNSKIPHILGGANKSATNALKKLIDKINKGDTSVFFDNRITPTKDGETFNMIELFKKDKYITDLLLADRETILNDFDTEVGIKSLPYDKKERLVKDEANIKGEEAQTKLNAMVETINSDLQEVNKLFGTSFSCDQISKEDEEVLEDEQSDIDADRNV